MIGLDPNDSVLQADPYPTFDVLREQYPVHWSDQFNRFLISRHEDVRQAYRNHELFSTAPFGIRNPEPSTADRRLTALESTFAQQMLFLGPPDHTRLRKLVSRVFTPRAIAAQEPRIEDLTRELLTSVRGHDSFDLIANFAGPLPVLMIAEMVGVPVADQEQFRHWGDDLASLIEPGIGPEQRERALAAADDMRQYLVELVARRRCDPQNDILTDLILAEEQGNSLSTEEIVGMVMLLTSAGHETTTSLLANCVRLLVEDPAILPRLADDPALRRTAIEETLRFEPPIQYSTRLLADDVTMHGVTMPAGSLVGLVIAAANRDPRVFDQPEHFDPTRRDNPHLSFATGIHACLGASLARLEADVALRIIATEFPTLHTDASDFIRKSSATLHGFTKLPAALPV